MPAAMRVGSSTRCQDLKHVKGSTTCTCGQEGQPYLLSKHVQALLLDLAHAASLSQLSNDAWGSMIALKAAPEWTGRCPGKASGASWR